jgi:hypothetical protein
MKTFWISMGKPHGGKGRVALVDAETAHLARARGHQLGLYEQGDEFYIVEIPPTELEWTLPRDRIVTEEELRAVGACTVGELSKEMMAIAADLGVFDADKTN